jgi:hypothetical protein
MEEHVTINILDTISVATHEPGFPAKSSTWRDNSLDLISSSSITKLQGIAASSQIGRGWVGDETLYIGEGQIRRAVGSGDQRHAQMLLGVRRHKGCISDQLVHRGMHGGCSTGNGTRECGSRGTHGWRGSAAVPGMARASSAVVSENGARDGLCGDGCRFPSRSWSGSGMGRQRSGMEMARPRGRGAADFWAWPRGRGSGLVALGSSALRDRASALGTGMTAAGMAGMSAAGLADGVYGVCRVGGCGDGGCGNDTWVDGNGRDVGCGVGGWLLRGLRGRRLRGWRMRE